MSLHPPSSFSKVAIIGTGFGGLGMAYYLKQAGIKSFTLFEKAAEVGGTWRENTYPGSGCDLPSHLYSFSFERHYPWSWRYPKQAEIHEYQRHCARKYGLYPHIRFGCELAGARFDEARARWILSLASGEVHETEFLITAVGQLNRPAIPKIPGLDRFQGKAFHSAEWDHGYDLNGKTVAVIGTGASAVQFVPEIARRVQRLHVYQRTPGWVIPKVERAFSDFERRLLDRMKWLLDLDRARIFGITEALGFAYRGHKWAEAIATGFARSHIHRQVRDPVLRKKLTPDYPIGCKRALLSNDWLPALIRPNVEVVTDAITEITATGIRTADGQLRKVDALILGTGFAASDFLAPMQIHGLEGRELASQWKQGAESFLGMSAPGFPNLFVLYGPNTSLGSGSIIYMLEQQQRYVVQLIQAQAATGYRTIDVRPAAVQRHMQEIRARSARSTYEGGCKSWYQNAEGLNTNNWVGSQREFARRTQRPDLANYEMSGPVVRDEVLASMVVEDLVS
ncbi:NAD(P)/FAD-dependent oxidoreductase [Solimonas sp. K1W22B-7]|uniref:flavin-containing monooxygenase n=1 Tax=Solimonas sp. K1W22B-7 TaxID=2303331 RepID=UPI000E333474|nr:NAD(P)/FAD-dependent oxidoreductase [Solimonas sp. K1W22B-7]AXQ31139.1 NAD(P)/FAD-dependent oxidoreductase [Solimonas sp. K1W22B-7]